MPQTVELIKNQNGDVIYPKTLSSAVMVSGTSTLEQYLNNSIHDVFYATVNETTGSELVAAYNAGKFIVAKDSSTLLVLNWCNVSNPSDPSFYFNSTQADEWSVYWWAYNSGGWEEGNISLFNPDNSDFESTSNMVTSLTSGCTDSQYPSAKCVYDAIGNVEALLQSI